MARLRASAVLLVTMIGSVLPGFAQTALEPLTGVALPTFVALDTRAGITWLYVSEHGLTGPGQNGTGGGRILRFDLTNATTTPQVVANRGTADGEFIGPDAILVDATTGDLFIADRFLHRIQRITPLPGGLSTFVMKWGQNVTNAADEMAGPLGLARDSAGAIYVSEHDAARVSKYTLNGTAAPTLNWRRASNFHTPYGIAINGTTVLVSDGFNTRVQALNTSDGLAAPEGGFPVPANVIPLGLTINGSDLWVAEAEQEFRTAGTIQRINKRTLAGAETGFVFGTQGVANNQFRLPFHIVINTAGTRAYVADYDNNRIAVWNLAVVTDTTAPTVSSLAPGTATTTAATYTLTFNELVTGVNAGPTGDFTAVTSSGVTATIGTASPASGSSQTWTIPVTYSGPAGGTVRLDLNTSSHGIADVAANPLVGGFTGGVVTIPSSDTAAPTISGFTVGTNNTTVVNFPLTFNEAVTGVVASSFTVNQAGGATGTPGTPTGSGTTWSVPVTFGGTPGGTISLTAKSSASGISDLASNAYAGGGTATSAVFTVPGSGADTTAPTALTFAFSNSVTVNQQDFSGTAEMTITFSEPVTGVDMADFAINTSASGATITGVTPAATATATSWVIAFSYTGTAQSVQMAIRTSSTGIVDVASNAFVGEGATGTDLITVNRNPPADMVLPSVSSFTAGTQSGSNLPFTLTFSEAVANVTSGDILVKRTGSATANVSSITPVSTTVYTVNVTVGGTGTVQLVAIGGVTSDIRDTGTHWFIGSGNATTAAVNVPSGGSAPTIAAQSTSGTVGTPVNYQVVATGATSFTATVLPTNGLSMSASGLITGTPTAVATHSPLVTATNANGSNNATVTITIAAAGTAPTIAAQSTSGTVGTPVNYQVVATGATSFTATVLPTNGLSMTASGLITGTPSAAATHSPLVTATNSNGSNSATVTITIAAAAGTAPTIAAQSTTGTVGTPVSYQVVATGATSFTATVLPTNGLSMSSSGLITGTPNAVATHSPVVTAHNANGTNSATVTITIGAAGPAPTISSVSAPANGTYRAAQVLSFTATFSEAVTVTGTPRIALVIGATTRQANYVSGSGTTAILFSYTVAATDNDTNGIAITPASVDLNGGTIRNSSATNATLTFTAPVTTGVLVDGTAPTAPVISAITDDTGTAGDRITSDTTLTFSGTAEIGSTVSLTRTGTGVIGSATAAATTGAWSIAYATALTEGNHSFTATATDGAGNISPVSAAFTVTVQIAAPVVTASTFSGTVGTSSTFTLVASNGPTSYAIMSGAVPPGMTFSTSAGTITGSPTTVGSTSMTVTATNSVGASPAATISFNIAAAPVVNPPAGGGGGGGGVITPPAKSSQTISFTGPTGTVLVDRAASFSATSSSGLPVSVSVVSGNATVSGSSVTLHTTGPATLRASQGGNDSFNAASSVDIIVNASKNAQTITFAALSDTSATSGSITLGATASSGLPITYTVSGPVTISGTTLALNGSAGTVSISAAQAGNNAYNAAATVTRTFAVRSVGAQVFFGLMGNDPFAAGVSTDGLTGIFLAHLLSSGQGVVARFTINADGSFSTQSTASIPAANIANGFFVPPTAAAGQVYTVNGTVKNGVISGTIVELGTAFTANVQPSVGTTASVAGVYAATTPGGASGDTYIVAGPTGQAFALAITPSGVTSGTGTIGTDGAVNINSTGGGTITANIDTSTGSVTGTSTAGGVATNFTGLSEATTSTAKLVNLSSRLRFVTGDSSRSVIAGFYVSGTEAKRLLIRAVGPGLTAFGVGDALANPKLQLFRGTTMLAENDDWSNSTDVSDTGDSVGAFRLTANSRDSALTATLEAGAYTAVVTGVTGNGVVLVEVYDAASNTPLAAQELVNISTRGFVDVGEANLIAGFVVTGNAPKKLLIRGIGPSLTQFGVTGAVADPSLRVFASGNATPIAQNNDWGVGLPVNAGQLAATAEDIMVASTAAGAFPLAAGTRDAAVVISLMPGQYSAVVNGAGVTTGAGLIEVYEISDR